MTKKTQTYILLAGVGLMAVFAVKYISSRPVWDKESLLMGKYLQSKMETLEKIKAVEKEVALLEKSIADKEAEIKRRDAVITQKEGIIAGLNTNLGNLQTEYLTLTDCPAQRANLLAQVEKHIQSGVLKDGIIYELRGEIVLYQGKFVDAQKIAEQFRLAYEAKSGEADACFDVQKAVAKELARVKLISKAKSAVILVAGGGIAYALLRGPGK